MQLKSQAAADLTAYFDSGEYRPANRIDLVLERLPSGEFAYLKPDDDHRRRSARTPCSGIVRNRPVSLCVAV
jgi:hypothetical protein